MGDRNRGHLAGVVTLGVRSFGDPSGRPVLFVHGYSSSRWAAGWTLSGRALADHRLRVVAVDRPGYGRSSPAGSSLAGSSPAGSWPAGSSPTGSSAAGSLPAGSSAWVEAVAELVEGVGRVVLVGVSMGASSALALAVARPDLVSGVALLSPMPPVPAARWAPASRMDAFYWQLARRTPWLLHRLCAASAHAVSRAAAAAASGAAAEAGAAGAGVDGVARVRRAVPSVDRAVFGELAGAAVDAFVADAAETGRQGGAAMADDLITHLRPWTFAPNSVEVPVWLVHGIQDPKVPVALARRLAAELPHVTETYLPGGHFAPFADQNHLARTLAEMAAG